MNLTLEIEVSDPDFDMLRHPILRGFMIILGGAVMIAGFIGNSAIVYIVIRNKKMRNVTNFFIVNLAMSDISLCLFSLPIQMYYQLTDHWIFGEVLCRVVFPAFVVPLYVSNFTIFLIAFDRYQLILYPLKAQLTIVKAVLSVIFIIILSLLFAIPVFVSTSVYQLNQTDIGLYRHYCIETWQSQTGRKVYSTISFFIQFCLPLCVTSYLYYKIFVRLKKRTKCRMSNNNERKQKTNRILIAIVFLFAICWLPWNLFSLLTELSHGLVKGSHFKFVDLILKVFAMSSSCVNPFLYCWLNDNFRKEIADIGVQMKQYSGRQKSKIQHYDAASSQHHVNSVIHAADSNQSGAEEKQQLYSKDVSGNVCPINLDESDSLFEINCETQDDIDNDVSRAVSCAPSNATSIDSLGETEPHMYGQTLCVGQS